jgi:hypothetical protein
MELGYRLMRGQILEVFAAEKAFIYKAGILSENQPAARNI